MSVEEATPLLSLIETAGGWTNVSGGHERKCSVWRGLLWPSTYFTLQILSIWKLSYLNEQTSCCAIDDWQERGSNLHRNVGVRRRQEQDRASIAEEPMNSQRWAPESQKYKILLFAQKILKICYNYQWTLKQERNCIKWREERRVLVMCLKDTDE